MSRIVTSINLIITDCLQRAPLEKWKPSADIIIPHLFSFDCITVGSTGDTEFNSRLVRKITGFVVVFQQHYNKYTSKPLQDQTI